MFFMRKTKVDNPSKGGTYHHPQSFWNFFGVLGLVCDNLWCPHDDKNFSASSQILGFSPSNLLKKQRKILSVFEKFGGENRKILNVAQTFFFYVGASQIVRN